jgi:hypothetical protein
VGANRPNFGPAAIRQILLTSSPSLVIIQEERLVLLIIHMKYVLTAALALIERIQKCILVRRCATFSNLRSCTDMWRLNGSEIYV